MSVPFKMQQLTTPTARASALLRPLPRRRSSCAVQDLRRVASQLEPRQDQRPFQGRLPPSHREARPAPSSGRAQGLSSGGPRTWPTSRGRRSGTTWRHALRHVYLRRTPDEERPALRSSSPRPPRSFGKQEQYAAIAAHLLLLPIQARVVSCASASTSLGSTGPHLRSVSGLRVWAAARARRTATFACPSACRAWRQPISATSGVSWRLRRPGTTPPGRNGDGLQGTSRAPRAARGSGSRWLMRSRSFNAWLHLPSSFKLGAPLGLHYSRPHGSVPVAYTPFPYIFSLPCWGRPTGCIIPKPPGPDPVACIFLHLPKLSCFPC